MINRIDIIMQDFLKLNPDISDFNQERIRIFLNANSKLYINYYLTFTNDFYDLYIISQSCFCAISINLNDFHISSSTTALRFIKSIRQNIDNKGYNINIKFKYNVIEIRSPFYSERIVNFLNALQLSIDNLNSKYNK